MLAILVFGLGTVGCAAGGDVDDSAATGDGVGDLVFPPEETVFPDYYTSGDIAADSLCVMVQGFAESCFDGFGATLWSDSTAEFGSPVDPTWEDGYGGFDISGRRDVDSGGLPVELAAGETAWATVEGDVPDAPALPFDVEGLNDGSAGISLVISCDLKAQIDDAVEDAGGDDWIEFFGPGIALQMGACEADQDVTEVSFMGSALSEITVEQWEPPPMEESNQGSAVLHWSFAAECSFGTWEARGVASVAE